MPTQQRDDAWANALAGVSLAGTGGGIGAEAPEDETPDWAAALAGTIRTGMQAAGKAIGLREPAPGPPAPAMPEPPTLGPQPGEVSRIGGLEAAARIAGAGVAGAVSGAGEALVDSTARLGSIVPKGVEFFGRGAEAMRDTAFSAIGGAPIVRGPELSEQVRKVAGPDTNYNMLGRMVGGTAAWMIPFSKSAKLIGIAGRAAGVGAETLGVTQSMGGAAAAEYALTGDPAQAAKAAILAGTLTGSFSTAPRQSSARSKRFGGSVQRHPARGRGAILRGWSQ